MPDNLSSAVEHSAEDAEKARADVCANCQNERAALLAELRAPEHEADVPTPLAKWANAGFPTLEPAKYVSLAVASFQADERQFDPSYNVTTEDPADIANDIRLLVELAVAKNRNDTTAGQIEEGVPAAIPAEAGQEIPLLVQAQELENESSDAHAMADKLQEVAAEKEGRTAELRHLQMVFNKLRAEGVSTVDALSEIVATTKSPETQQHLNAILSRVAMLQSVLPNKHDVVNRLLNTNGLKLAAATVAGSFADFITAVEADETLTADDRASIRRIIEGGDRQLKTGTQVRDAALATAIDPTTGEAVALHTADNKAKVAPGVYTYTETGQNVILEISEGHLHRQIDVTNLDGVSVGVLAEIMGVAALAEGNGAGGFIKHIYGVDFDRLADQGVDLVTLASVRQKLTHLIGTGYDGEIFQPEQQRALLETQMRLVSPSGTLLAWENDPDGYRESVEALGLDHARVLEAFGTYTQLHMDADSISREDVQHHLHRNFPQIVDVDKQGGEIFA